MSEEAKNKAIELSKCACFRPVANCFSGQCVYCNKSISQPNQINLTMKEQLSIKLQLYLGDLLEQYKTTYDYFEKRKLAKKINAVELILEIKQTDF